MKHMAKKNYLALLATVGMALSLSACADRVTENSSGGDKVPVKKTAVWVKKKPVVVASASERECLARAMYFESDRSSTEGMLAVGSVVMNRVESGRYGNSICSVVGAPRQFAPGVLSRPMADRSAPVVRQVAKEVLSGERHAKVGEAMHFHMAGLKFPYKNMHYVTVAGGNAFYEKRDRRNVITPAAPVVQVASVQPERQAPAPTLTAFGRDDGFRSGAVIPDLNAKQAVSVAAVTQFGVSPASLAPTPVVAAVTQFATPLPPRRPKQLGLAPLTADEHASATPASMSYTTFRVADGTAGTPRVR